MNNNIYFSICIPAYNGEKYIGRAIESALNQKYDKKFEIVVFDDNSSDNTEKVVNKYSKVGVKYVKNKENIGMVNNWNKCLKSSNGKYVLLLHQDDVLNSGIIQVESDYLDDNGELGIIGTREEIIFTNNKLLNLKCKIKNFIKKLIKYDKHIKIYSSEKFCDFIKSGHYIPCSSVTFKRSILKDTDYFSKEFPFSADEEFWPRILIKYNIARIEYPYVKRYMHNNNFEYYTWQNEKFPINYCKLFYTIWKYSNYDAGVKNILSERWLQSMLNIIKSGQISRKTILQYKEYINMFCESGFEFIFKDRECEEE